jgi:hypothetical protein
MNKIFFFFFAVDGPLFDRLLETVNPTTATGNTNIQETVALIQRLSITCAIWPTEMVVKT